MVVLQSHVLCSVAAATSSAAMGSPAYEQREPPSAIRSVRRAANVAGCACLRGLFPLMADGRCCRQRRCQATTRAP
eukprot:1561581-Prymnesium_polylepis.2